MSGNPRRRATAAEVLEAAAEVFAEQGYRGATLDEVAARFGITRQGVLHYYASKQDLFTAVLERDRGWVARRAVHAINDAAAPLRSLTVFLGTSDEELRRIRLSHVLRGEAIRGDETALAFTADRTRVVRAHVLGLVTATAGLSSLRTGWTVDSATDAVIAMIDGLQTAVLLGHPIDPAALFLQFLDSIAALPQQGAPDAH